MRVQKKRLKAKRATGKLMVKKIFGLRIKKESNSVTTNPAVNPSLMPFNKLVLNTSKLH